MIIDIADTYDNINILYASGFEKQSPTVQRKDIKN